jgi:hypothetical protein
MLKTGTWTTGQVSDPFPLIIQKKWSLPQVEPPSTSHRIITEWTFQNNHAYWVLANDYLITHSLKYQQVFQSTWMLQPKPHIAFPQQSPSRMRSSSFLAFGFWNRWMLEEVVGGSMVHHGINQPCDVAHPLCLTSCHCRRYTPRQQILHNKSKQTAQPPYADRSMIRSNPGPHQPLGLFWMNQDFPH